MENENDKKLNGWNNPQSAIDGIGGKPPINIKPEKMNAEGFTKEKGGVVNIHIEPNDAIYIKERDVYRLMEKYHKAEVEKLGLAIVRDTLIEYEDWRAENFVEDDAATTIDWWLKTRD